ncbi:heme oxygenase-like protein [Aaosphaeria arxii CBS 175.79]|uniref:Heme oxygenase-like protein n=1 Tax=Aaosphaeria arxii CBS 175.79 TaxID=1450172 RepID=A0A6A5XNU3_9PLEO|nr:heme oxygenase-like protein [Aaosphaeria arxii CBS 175.79]KAF2014024.1 heme oxygenase-like protein [Aaosphaeria arxii CBS 175.79]
MGRHANPDIRRAFAEFQDTDTPSKCNKVRCLHCGFVRAKNTTRQIEHLQDCAPYLASADAQLYLSQQANNNDASNAAANNTKNNNSKANSNTLESNGPVAPQPPNPNILSGKHPNPNLQVHRRGTNLKRSRDSQPIAPHPPIPQHPATPSLNASLTAHLLAKSAEDFRRATQQPFLSHAGCGSLAQGPLSVWLVQDGHRARGYIRFVGQLLAKIRLPQTANSQFHPMYRTMDLLISALNNMRREMQFFEITATKYGLGLSQEAPSPITRALLDLFVSASSSSASLLEGMVVLWGTEHCYRSAWQYASSFSATLTSPSTDSHIVALHQALIPNWTSPAFHKFVDATRALVDELANITTTRDGKEEMQRCEEIFQQICWLEERFWPDVDGMGEEDESGRLDSTSMGMNGVMNGPMGAPSLGNGGLNGQGLNNGNGTPVTDGRNSFGLAPGGGLDNVDQSS